MLNDQMRSAIATAPRAKLPELAALLWRAYGDGRVSEAEAEALSAAIDARKTLASASAAAPRRQSGARPRTPESLARRRRWAASGALPPQLAARFTLAEVAALAVVVAEVAKHGHCTLTLGHIAALAGVCRTSVRNALREARVAGLVRIEERRRAACRSAPNRVTITSPEWRAWVARRGGVTKAHPTNTGDSEGRPLRPWAPAKEASGDGGRQVRQRHERRRSALAVGTKSDKISYSDARVR